MVDFDKLVRAEAPENVVTDAEDLMEVGGRYPGRFDAAWWDDSRFGGKQGNFLIRPLDADEERFDGFLLKKQSDGTLVTVMPEGEEPEEEIKTHCNILFANYSDKKYSKFGMLMTQAQRHDPTIDTGADLMAQLDGRYFVFERINLLRGPEPEPDLDTAEGKEEFMTRLLTFRMEKTCSHCEEPFEGLADECAECGRARARIPNPVHMIVDAIENWEDVIGDSSSWKAYAKKHKIAVDDNLHPTYGAKPAKKAKGKKSKASSVEAKQDAYKSFVFQSLLAVAKGEGEFDLDEMAEAGEKVALDDDDVVKIVTEAVPPVITAALENGGLTEENWHAVLDGVGLRENDDWRGNNRKERSASEKKANKILSTGGWEIDDEGQVVEA